MLQDLPVYQGILKESIMEIRVGEEDDGGGWGPYEKTEPSEQPGRCRKTKPIYGSGNRDLNNPADSDSYSDSYSYSDSRDDLPDGVYWRIQYKDHLFNKLTGRCNLKRSNELRVVIYSYLFPAEFRKKNKCEAY